jgi:diguanylate cyclase (GGDEF)-like protein
MGDLLQSCLTVTDAYTVLGEYSEKLFPELSGAMYALTQSRNLLEVVSKWGKYSPVEMVFETDSCWAMRRARFHSVADAQTRIKCQHVATSTDAFSPYMCVPMTAHGESLGLLHLVAPSGEDITERKQLSTTIAERAALAISNLKLREELRLQSILDPLTGLFNRRYFEKTLEREISRAVRHNRPVGIFMFDALLHEIGYYLKKHIRGEDIACRYGGDEFMIVLPDASLSSAKRRAEEICTGITQLCIIYQDKNLEGNSVSVGVACFPLHGKNAEQLVKAADKALYDAKEAGRNCVRVAQS